MPRQMDRARGRRHAPGVRHKRAVQGVVAGRLQRVVKPDASRAVERHAIGLKVLDTPTVRAGRGIDIARMGVVEVRVRDPAELRALFERKIVSEV